jgi:hypothetical protein
MGGVVKITFEVDGRIKFIYDDSLAEIAQEVGELTIKRASHVEPVFGEGWEADMSPVGGPVLGPFFTRGAALEAEREWLVVSGIPRPR